MYAAVSATGITGNTESRNIWKSRMETISETGLEMASCTGFIYEHDDQLWLITNAHNITRMNAETGERITTSAAFPVMIIAQVKQVKEEGGNTVISSSPVHIMLSKEAR